MNNTVTVLKCEKYDADLILTKMNEAWELCGGKDSLNVSGKKVLLKPNVLSDAAVSKAATTHPEFLRAAIRFCKTHGAAEIFAGDSPGFQKPGFKAKNCGLYNICKDEEVEWYDFSQKNITLACPEGQMVKQFVVSDIYEKADVIISLPKLKTHQLMFFTGAVKNQFGMIPGLLKSSFHMRFPNRNDFAAMIVDLHSALKPSFAFIDGITSMEGPGPGNGIPKETNLMLASSNLVALDAAACRIIGYDPDIIPILRNAIDRELWLVNSNDYEIKGLSIEEAKIENFQKIRLTGSNNQLKDFLIPRFLRRFRYNLNPKPFFSKSKCIRCGACIKICPAKALEISKTEKMVKIDYTKCIRCFCCHEVCPEDAIVVKRTPGTSGLVS